MPLQGVVANCDEAGRVLEVMRDDLGLFAGRVPDFRQLIALPDQRQFDELLKAATSQRPAFDWVLAIDLQSGLEMLHFGAALFDGRIRIMVARDRGALSRLIDPAHDQNELTLSNPEQDVALYNDLARLNNELATAERRLTKTNLQLDKANRELQALYESLPVGIFRTNAAGTVEAANGLFSILAGVSSPDQWQSHVHPDDAEGVGRRWRQTISQGDAFESVHRQSIEGQPVRHLAMKAVVLRDANGKSAGVVGILADVSGRILAEERQREIERQQAVSQLTGGLAHNLNNIMMVVMSTAEQLQEDLPSEHELQAVAEKNLMATQRAAALTRRLLLYSGQGALAFVPTDVDSAVNEISHDLRAALGGRHEVALALAAAGTKIKLNKSLLGESLQELVANATAAMAPGGTIYLSTALLNSGTPDRRFVVISVSDSGVGMDRDTMRRATQPFFTTQKVGQGMGLGLSMADGATRIAGGVLKIRSRVGKGTVVELHFPIF